jgi:YD repeat-containing protein
MHTKLNDRFRKVLFRFMLGGIALFLGLGSAVVHAQEARVLESGPYHSVTAVTLPEGNIIEEIIINGPPVPPPGFEVERQAVSLPEAAVAAALGIKILTEVPAFSWVLGCSAVSGAMIAGYYDRMGWSNMYTGAANGGVMPLNNSTSYWPTWLDGSGHLYPSCPLIASKNGVDGRTTRGSIDDYWVKYWNTGDPITNDPYITNGWTQHTWGDAIGDYMKTSQSAFGNVDGSTVFYTWQESPPLTCSDMASTRNGSGVLISTVDGTYGRKLFYEARGYTVTDCYNQFTDNRVAGGFSFAQFKEEIDAGRPVMLNLEGHTVVGVGYDDSSNLVYIHDTWDYNNHTMTWGGSYLGMLLRSVSIVNLQGVIENFVYVAQDDYCGGKSPCFTIIQDAIDSAQSHTVIEISQQMYYEGNVIFDDPKVGTLRGGWDMDFTGNSSYTTINGSITITNGTMIIENIILQ